MYTQVGSLFVLVDTIYAYYILIQTSITIYARTNSQSSLSTSSIQKSKKKVLHVNEKIGFFLFKKIKQNKSRKVWKMCAACIVVANTKEFPHQMQI